MFREKGKKFNWGCVEIKVAESHPYGEHCYSEAWHKEV